MTVSSERNSQSESGPDRVFSESPPCLLCGSTRFSLKYDLGPHKILRCKDCTFMCLHPLPSKEELKEVYDIGYFQNDSFYKSDSKCIYGYFDYFSERLNKQANFLKLIEEIVGYMDNFEPDISRFLDIGCGLGYLLDVASDKGFQVTGVEFNPEAVKRIKKKYVFPVFCGDFMDYDDKDFDVITMLDVIEHLMDPKAAAKKINQLLRPGGILVMSTMDGDSLVSRLLGTRLADFRRVREHLYFFNRKTISMLLETEGFEVIKIKSYGHTFRMDFLADRIKLVSPTTGKVFDKIIRFLHISMFNFYINPHTKIIVYLRKKRLNPS
ncbi:class I SAM-dependent methyltransferase [bacterium]|nr:class I SAM-dependent methyltransferase [bacterium]